jgi:hypothetical protein
MKIILHLALTLLVSSNCLLAQNDFFTVVPSSDKNLPTAFEKVQYFKKISVTKVNETALRTYLSTAPLEFHNNGVTLPLAIPLPNGEVETFGLVESPVLSAEQAALHPEIKTYTGNGLKNKKYVVRLSLTALGFNAIVLNVDNDAVYFEHYSKDNSQYYFSYFTRDASTPKHYHPQKAVCGVESSKNDNGSVNLNPHRAENTPENNTGATLRTYRIAIAATGEFTQTHTGANDAAKQTAALSTISEYVNRMNAVYRNELCVSFTLVSGTNVVYPNGGTDPYTNGNGSALIGENETNLTAVIGLANFDIGHVLGTSLGSGEGLATSPSLCDTDKARGYTGQGNLAQFGQIFFDQALFHEIGHQFSMSHSFNSSIPVCTTRRQGTSVEPGAGATIMSYGFTCGTDNYPNTTSGPTTTGPILTFHTASYSQAVTYMGTTIGSSCGTSTVTSNTLPVVTEPANYTIPKSTPFTLTGSATDANGDALTYCWEGTDIGEVAAPDAATLANTAKPPFSRTYEPATTGTRNFPILSAILDGTNQAKGDKLPSVAFAAKHRLTVRDNRSGGGSTVFKEITTTVDATSGPFLETTNLAASYAGNSSQTITWSVNGTTAAPVSCANVKISLSTDGGTTFPTVLLASTPNDGTESVTLPNTATTTARIKVEAVGNIFFDISNSNFAITASLPVELVELKAKAQKQQTILTWKTASEKNNLGFDIEKSTDGQTFEKIGFVKGFGTTQAPQYYSFTDSKLNQLSYYRLRQVDYDGTAAYSNIVSANYETGNSKVKIYPNPTSNSQITMDFAANTEGVLVVNTLGQIVFQQKLSGQTQLRLDISTWVKGVYFIKTDGHSEAIKFVKQ